MPVSRQEREENDFMNLVADLVCAVELHSAQLVQQFAEALREKYADVVRRHGTAGLST